MQPLDIALSLAARGLFVFPCNASPASGRQKQPLVAWRSASTVDAEAIARQWGRFPRALVGIDLAKSGLYVVDPDRHDPTRDGPAMWQELCQQHGWRDDHAPRVSTASLGEHIYFRNADPPFGNKAPMQGWIDGRGHGGYVIAPGSSYDDDSGFWRHAIETPPIWEAPAMPAWLVALLKGEGGQEPAPATPLPSQKPRAPLSDARREAILRAAIEGEVAALRSTGEGGRNNQLNTSAFNLAQFVPLGMISEGEVMGELLPIALDIGLKRGEAMATIRSGIRGGKANPRTIHDSASSGDGTPDIGPLNQGRAVAAVISQGGDALIDPETGEIEAEIAEAEPEFEIAWPEPLGMMREIRDYVLSGAHKPNPTLALSSAIATMSHLCSRHLCTPTYPSLNLFVVGLGRTGVGKDWPLKAPLSILRAMDRRAGTGSGFTNGFTAGKWKSDAAIEGVLASRPAQIAVIDEMGQLLNRMTDRRASTHEKAMGDLLRELWSQRPGEKKPTSVTASRSSVMIEYACLVLFGVATPEEFYKALAGSMLENGFVNRLLIMPAPRLGVRRELDSEAMAAPVPADLVERLLTLLPEPQGNIGNIAFPLSSAMETETVRVPWRDNDVARAFQAGAATLDEMMQEGGTAETFYGRTAEMGLRIATLHALGRTGRGAGMSVTAEDMAFGMDIARSSANASMRAAREHMAENDHQAKYKRVLRLIKARGKKGIVHRDLQRALCGALNIREIESVLDSAIEAGEIDRVMIKGKRKSVRSYYPLKP